MHRQSLALLFLLLAISGWIMWARWPIAMPDPASAPGGEPQIIAVEPTQSPTESPMPVPPTPPPPMPTPALTEAVGADWQSFASPYWGVTFRYPPGWTIAHNGQELGSSNIVLEEERGKWLVGSPLELSSIEGNQERIYLYLNYYLLSDEGSLAEWVTLNSQYSDIMGVREPYLDLYAIPATYLPEGVSQGIYTINPNPIRPSYQVWLTYNDLVFNIGSTYSRQVDVARIFAIISSMQFDPIPEERLLASNSFYGDENTLRQEIANARPIEPPCDWDCQMQEDYNMRMQALHDAMIQPPRDRPMMQAVNPVVADSTWQTYTQSILGLSFRYPSGLTIEDPFVENNLDESSALQESIIIKRQLSENFWQEALKIELFPYTVSEDVPLHNWEAIQDQLNRALHPENQFRYRLPVPINHEHIPQTTEDIVHTRQQAAYYQLDTFWITKDGVVFRLTNNDLVMLQLAAGIFATIEFDTEQLATLRALNIFAGDERTMLNELAEQWDKPRTPTPDPLSTATPYPTIIPYPTATPSPTPIPVTVTPSAFESPLVNGLKRYQGETFYTTLSPYEIRYDPTKWQLLTYMQEGIAEPLGLYLAHQTINGCEISLTSWFPHAIPLAPISLAGREWSIYYPGGNGVAYSTGWEGGSQIFFVALPDPLRAPYDPNAKTPCELEAEVVFDTLIVLDQAQQGAALPTVTPTP